CILGTIAIILLILYVPGIPPHVEYEAFDVDPAHPREGPLAKNYILDSAERMYEGELICPESMASRAVNELFVSLHNGSIARVWGHDFEKVKIVATIGPGCAGPWEESICGRPLGLRFSDRKLIVADSYLGIFEVDIDTGKKVRLVDPDVPIGGLKPKVIDDLDIDSDGNIYWSDASTQIYLEDGLVELISQPSGRLIKYDAKTKKNEVLIPRVHFANGVQLSPAQDFVLVSETFRHKVRRYWLKGPKAGTSDIFVSGLPGMPDNIRPRKDGGYYLSLVTSRNPDHIDFYDLTSRCTGLRKFLARATAIVQNFVKLINYYYPNKFCANFSYKIFSLGVISNWIYRGETIIVEVDEVGKIIGSLQGSTGIVKLISETQQIGDNLFFGSPYVPFLGRLRLDKKSAGAKKPSSGKKPSVKAKEEL
ncbi:Adipocyte plasma membrane-associated protein, partial [Armadillidium nasatum]